MHINQDGNLARGQPFSTAGPPLVATAGEARDFRGLRLSVMVLFQIALLGPPWDAGG